MALISISIDICDSTNIKRKIMELSSSDKNNIIKLYGDLAKKLYQIELNFYFQLVNNGIDLENIFVIKGIGDEIWVVYDLKDIELKTLECNSIIYKILNALIEMNFKHYSLCISERELTLEEEQNFKLQKNIKIEHIMITPKVYIDLINEYQEISHIRYDVFTKLYNNLFTIQGKISDETKKEKFSIYINRLNIGTYLGNNDNKSQILHRFDPFGYEVDLFFRCSKSAKPGLISLGEQLFSCFFLEEQYSFKTGSFIEKFKFPEGYKGSVHYHYFNCIMDEISKEDLKGIGKKYQIYYLYNKQFLPTEIIQLKSKPVGIFENTIKYLVENNGI
ncbi:MAG TPA: hypothetical protein PKY81_07410 [bacterium]|nr:hypothetical protein [bacterium]